MKSIVAIACLLLVPVLAFAADYEVDQGAIEIGGELFFQSAGGDAYENADGDGQTRFGIMPEGHYFVMPGLGIGGVIGFESSSWGDEKSSTLSIGPSVQYYIGADADKNILPFVGAAFLFRSESFDNGAGFDGTNTMTTIHFTGGGLFRLVDHYAIKGGIFVDLDSVKPEGSDESFSGTTFGLLVGFTGFIF